MSLRARRNSRRGNLTGRLRNAAVLLLTLTSAASCGVLVGPAPPSLLGPGPDLPSADGGVDVPPFPGTGGLGAGSGGGPGGCLGLGRQECRGNEVWDVSGCTGAETLLDVCASACVTTEAGGATCFAADGQGGQGGNGGAAP